MAIVKEWEESHISKQREQGEIGGVKESNNRYEREVALD